MSPVYSRFRLFAYTVTHYIVLFPAGAFLLMLYLRYSDVLDGDPSLQVAIPAYLVFTAAAALVTAVYWFFNMRKWVSKLIIDDYSIRAKGFYGLGTEREWRWQELQGYAVRKRYQKGHGLFEELSVLYGGKAVLIIVGPVFANYDELKAIIASRLEHIPE